MTEITTRSKGPARQWAPESKVWKAKRVESWQAQGAPPRQERFLLPGGRQALDIVDAYPPTDHKAARVDIRIVNQPEETEEGLLSLYTSSGLATYYKGAKNKLDERVETAALWAAKESVSTTLLDQAQYPKPYDFQAGNANQWLAIKTGFHTHFEGSCERRAQDLYASARKAAGKASGADAAKGNAMRTAALVASLLALAVLASGYVCLSVTSTSSSGATPTFQWQWPHKKMARLEATVKGLEGSNASLSTFLDNATAEADALGMALNQTHAALTEAQQEVGHLQRTGRAQKGELERAQLRIRSMASDAGKSQQEKASLAAQIEEERKETRAARLAAAALESDKRRLVSQLQDRQAQPLSLE